MALYNVLTLTPSLFTNYLPTFRARHLAPLGLMKRLVRRVLLLVTLIKTGVSLILAAYFSCIS